MQDSEPEERKGTSSKLEDLLEKFFENNVEAAPWFVACIAGIFTVIAPPIVGIDKLPSLLIAVYVIVALIVGFSALFVLP